MAEAKRSSTGIISVEKPTWFPLIEETSDFPTYGTPITIGTAVSISPTFNYETTQDYGDGIVQDQFTAFGGAEVSLTTNGYTNKVLSDISGATFVGGGILRSGDDIAPDGAFVYRRKKSNGHYRYTILYKGQFALSSDESQTQEGNSITFTHPEWTGTFVDVPGIGYMWSVDSDDDGVDPVVIKNWFSEVKKPVNYKATKNTGGDN
ncbi:major tail protein [Vagococcus sp. JNUCC 83]